MRNAESAKPLPPAQPSEPYLLYERLLAQTPTTKIFRARSESDQQLCLVKEINLELIKDDELKLLLYQMKLCKGLSHSNLIPHKYSLVKDDSIIMVSELQLIKLSTVMNRLFPHGIKEFKLVCSILKPIAAALEYLHSKELIHRNIASSSIYFKENGEVTVNYYCHLEKNKKSESKGSIYRNICYLSPEMLRDGEGGYDKQVDIWSFGILAHELIIGRNPFCNDSYYESMKKILNEDPPKLDHKTLAGISKGFLTLVQKCLSKDPSKRPTAQELRKYFDHHRNDCKREFLKEKIIDRIFLTGNYDSVPEKDWMLENCEECSILRNN
jgi:serine/threonine protein kinase